MKAVYGIFLILSISAALILVGLGVFAVWIILLTTESSRVLPFSALLVLIWFSGCYGIYGLLRATVDLTLLDPAQLRSHCVFLCFGLFAALAMVILLSLLAILSGPDFYWIFWVSGVFPGVPAAVAITRLVPLSRQIRVMPINGPSGILRLILFLSLIPVAVLVWGLVARESIVWWYGHNLAAQATRSAQQLAQGSSYCIRVTGLDYGTASLADIDGRQLARRALQQALDPRNNNFTGPNLLISLNRTTYGWSFRSGRFLEIRGITHSAGNFFC